MPDPVDNAKTTGDAHPPEPENSGPPAADEGDEVEGTPGRGENQAGFLKEREGTGSGRDKNYG